MDVSPTTTRTQKTSADDSGEDAVQRSTVIALKVRSKSSDLEPLLRIAPIFLRVFHEKRENLDGRHVAL